MRIPVLLSVPLLLATSACRKEAPPASKATPSNTPAAATTPAAEDRGEPVKEIDSPTDTIERIADESMRAMESYAWPGNVRELRNVIERSMILSPGPVLEVSLVKAALPASSSPA